jgi:protein-disulfide isomerase
MCALLVCACAGLLLGQQTARPKASVVPGSSPKAASPQKSAFDKATLESYLRHQFLLNPQLKVSIAEPTPSEIPGFRDVKVTVGDANGTQEVLLFVSLDGQKIIQGKVFDISRNPFQPEIAKIRTEFQPGIGTPGAPVVLVVYSDFQCTFCREEAKMLRQNLLVSYPKQVRLYFKDFPIEQLHPWAKTASIAGRCIFNQQPAMFWDYHDWIFENQAAISVENLKSKVLEFATQKELDSLQVSRCIDTRATEAEVNRNLAEGRALQVNSTPTLFVNGRRLVGQVVWANLKNVIDYEIEYQKTAKNAGEDCGCEIKTPIPVSQ